MSLVLEKTTQRKKTLLDSDHELGQHHLALKESIMGWLEDEGITCTERPDFNSFFRLEAKLKNVPVEISESKVRRGVLATQGVAALSEDQLERVSKLKPEDKKSLFLSLYSWLDKREYLFLIQEDFAAETWVKIQRTLYVSDITRTSLLHEMKEINSRFVNISYLVNEALQGLVSSSSDSTIYE